MLALLLATPAYSFKVYAGNDLIWNGDLPADKPEVYFYLQAKNEKGNKLLPRLVIKRDLETDPDEHVIFFGESHIAKIATVSASGTSISAPQMQEHGWRVLISSDNIEIDRNFGSVKNGVADDVDYRLAIRLKHSE